MPDASTCQGCGARLAEAFPRVLDPQTGERFSLFRCTACGLGHTLPRPGDLRRYYGEAYHGGRHGFTGRYCIARRLQWLESALAPGSNARRVLDVGCGEGDFLAATRARGWQPMGTELEPALALGKGLEVYDSIEALPTEDSFDVVTFWHSLEHLPDPRGALSSVHRRLPVGGTLLLAVPDAGGLQAKTFGADWFHLDVPRHLYHFDAASLRALLERAGFRWERSWHGELEYDAMGWVQSAMNRWLASPGVENLFFRLVSGREPRVALKRRLFHLALGSMLSLPALPLSWLSSAVGRGGTLVVLARRE